MRNEIITAINDLFDENASLKYEKRIQEEYNKNLYENSNKNEIYRMTDIQKKLYDIGLEYLYDEAFIPYYSMRGYGDKNYYSFEEWIDNSIKLDQFADITKNEFINLFSEKMKVEYEKKLEKAKEEDRKEENE